MAVETEVRNGYYCIAGEPSPTDNMKSPQAAAGERLYATFDYLSERALQRKEAAKEVNTTAAKKEGAPPSQLDL